MRATVQPKKQADNLEKRLRLPLEKLRNNPNFPSNRALILNGRRLKRLFMSKVSTNCIREEKVTALKLHEVVCETLQLDIPLRSFRSVLKRYGKDMSSSFEFDDFLEIVRELSRDMSKNDGADGSGDSACLMRLKQEQQGALQKCLNSPRFKGNPNKTGMLDNATTPMARTDRSPATNQTPLLDRQHSQTARELSTKKPDKLTSTQPQPPTLLPVNQNVPKELCLSLDKISDPSKGEDVQTKNEGVAHEENLYSPVGHTTQMPYSLSLPHHHHPQSRQQTQFAAQAISIKKLEPNLIRLFVSDNTEKAEYIVNTKLILGKGSFGKVYKGNSASSRPYAIKELTSEFDEFEKNWKRTISRKSVQEKLRKCPYIYKIYHIAEEKKRRKYWHVFEMVEGISLHKIAHERKELVFKDQNLKFWFSQLFSAVHYLNYKLKIVHRDIKTDNVLILQNPSRIKLIDFDHATLWDEPISTSAGAPICLPPEVLMHGQHRYTPAADWWMIGVLLYDVITGRHPFLICKTLSETRGPRRSIDYDLTEENIKAGFKGFSSEHCSRLPNGARSLVHELLTYDPRMRLGFSCHDFECRILKHTFFSDFDYDRVWKWVELSGSESRMASSGDAKTRSRVSSIESPLVEEVAIDYHCMARTPTPKTSLCKHATVSYGGVDSTSVHPKLTQGVEMSRTNSLSCIGQQAKKRNSNATSSDANATGQRWAHTARVSPLALKSHDVTVKRKVQTSRVITGASSVNKLNETSRVVSLNEEHHRPTARPMKTDKDIKAPAACFSPGKAKSSGKIGQQATQATKYMMMQPLPCTISPKLEGKEKPDDARGHQ